MNEIEQWASRTNAAIREYQERRRMLEFDAMASEEHMAIMNVCQSILAMCNDIKKLVSK